MFVSEIGRQSELYLLSLASVLENNNDSYILNNGYPIPINQANHIFEIGLNPYQTFLIWI